MELNMLTRVAKTTYLEFNELNDFYVNHNIKQRLKFAVAAGLRRKNKHSLHPYGQQQQEYRYKPSESGYTDISEREFRLSKKEREKLTKVIAKANDKISKAGLTEHLVQSLLKCKGSDLGPAESFRWGYLESEIMSKFISDELADPQQRWDNAVMKLTESEVACAQLNEHGLGTSIPFEIQDNILQRARHIITKAIGLTPDIPDLMSRSEHGSGATACRSYKQSDVYYKYCTVDPLAVTAEAYRYAKAVIYATPLWQDVFTFSSLKVIGGNTVFSVNKKYDCDRLACKEPGCNAMMQRPVGIFFRQCLLSEGVNLRDQSVNQRLAFTGSVTGGLATIDLSAASDSISQRLIYELFPIDWVTFLDTLRSPMGFLPDGPNCKTGRNIIWEKHSTMGNGYTFELESLIFYALTKACRDYINTVISGPRVLTLDHSINTYGDDIICPTYCATLLIGILADCGFKTNSDKTFTTGPFRESCGKHYYNGVDVTPIYVRSPISTVSRMIWFLNAMKRFGNIDQVADPSTYDLWLMLKRKYVPNILWGGVNSQSICNLNTADKPRFTLREKSHKRRIAGKPAILRNFQFNNIAVAHETITWLRVIDSVGSTSAGRLAQDAYKTDLVKDAIGMTSDVSAHEIVDKSVDPFITIERNDRPTRFESIYYPCEWEMMTEFTAS